MTLPPSPVAPGALQTQPASTAASSEAERRRSQRLPVTVSARVRAGAAWHRTEILNVSDGGLLLAPMTAFVLASGRPVVIEAALIGEVRGRVVGASAQGIHVAVEAPTPHFLAGVRRLLALTQTWKPA